MFKSRFMDRFTRVHPAVVFFLFAPVIVVLLVLGIDRLGVVEAVAYALGGYLFWTLTEYWLHRTVFHFEPDNAFGRRLHWMIHGVHHDHPNDPLRLVMPPSASIPLALVFFAIFHVVLGPEATLAFGGGFLGGYLAYDMIHYHVHHHRPRTWAGRKLRELHMRHHFQDDEVAYGVSAPWWDYVFGTGARAERRERTTPPAERSSPSA